MQQEIDTIYDYLDSVDLLRDAIGTEMKIVLFEVLQGQALALAKLLARSKVVKERASKELKKLVIPNITDLLVSYRKSAKSLGEAFASSVLAKIKKIAKATRERPKPDMAEEKLILNLDSLTEVYVIEMKSIARNLLLGGLSEAEVAKKLEENIKNTGRETGTYFNAISSDVKSAIFQIADQAAQEAFAFENLQDAMRWVAFFTKTCADCIDRHNQVKSYDDWASEGLPRSGATVCRQHCHCVLVPDTYPVKIEQPLPRERARIE